MEEISNPPTDITFKKYIPIITVICGLVSIVLFIGINLQDNRDTWEAYRKWGAPSMTDIFGGDYWGLITSNFLHVEIWHIAFNLYWLWILGKKIEFETNKAFCILFILSSALVSSLAQLAFADTTGIGLSGIGYALFGFLFVKSKTTEEYKNYLTKNTVNLFLVWLVVGVILTKAGTWKIGNAAHIGGLLWGVLVAYTAKFGKYLQWATGLMYISGLTFLIFYSPFSTSYLSYQAYELHKAQQVDAAIEAYKKILKRDPDNEFANGNLKQLEVYRLEKKAIELHTKQKYTEAQLIYNQILSIDPNNEWAKENLIRLPSE
ncbi:rhomboid family intramembrane serine protease [Cytophagaceae bacterium DM2B3-1]|uniref:Rhomboid family intramembrane serine protease n=1 Tax=Xanthocytophaga flava TaxID=3048013 RepID=A0ABT7CFP5_9BACT|nr:rhomboid family intramembrane serine protease [Xanthocytophaga flavus]MDJ1491544.1 rhomboid family intramembrane serine protease [Xanthocytophaga flavus]